MSAMTLKDWVELVLLTIVTLLAGGRWLQSRETSDTDLSTKVEDLEDKQAWDHKQRRADVERINRDIGVVSTDVAKHDARLDGLEGRVDRIERRQDGE